MAKKRKKTSKKSSYESMLRKVAEIADRHPQSYVVVDAKTHELIESGTDAQKVFRQAKKKLRPNQVPVIYKKPPETEIMIFQANV